MLVNFIKTKLRGRSPQANYTDRQTDGWLDLLILPFNLS
jgi:hypothetical protein